MRTHTCIGTRTNTRTCTDTHARTRTRTVWFTSFFSSSSHSPLVSSCAFRFASSGSLLRIDAARVWVSVCVYVSVSQLPWCVWMAAFWFSLYLSFVSFARHSTMDSLFCLVSTDCNAPSLCFIQRRRRRHRRHCHRQHLMNAFPSIVNVCTQHRAMHSSQTNTVYEMLGQNEMAAIELRWCRCHLYGVSNIFERVCVYVCLCLR